MLKHVLASHPTPSNVRETYELLSEVATQLAKLRDWDRYEAYHTPKRGYQMVETISGGRRPTRSLCALPDGAFISGGEDNEVLVWRQEADKTWTSELMGRHSKRVTAVYGLPDGRVVSGSLDNTLRVWTRGEHGWEVETTIRLPHAPMCLQALSDGRMVTGFAEGSVIICTPIDHGHWEQVVVGCGCWVYSLQVLPDNTIVTAHTDGCIRFLSERESGTWNVRAEKVSDCFLQALRVLPDGRIFLGDFKGNVWELIPLDDGRYRSLVIGRHRGSVTSLQALPDGRIASGGRDKRLSIWERTRLGSWQQEEVESMVQVSSLRLLADGRFIAASDSSWAIFLFDGDPVSNGAAS